MKINTRPFFFFFLLLLLCSCQQKENLLIQEKTKEYYRTYQERSDFQKFLSFYDDHVVMEDIILGERKNGKKEFADFFDWSNPDFSKTDSLALIITNQLFQENQVLTQGYFTPFKWGEQHFEAMHFTTILTFNAKGKIIKQVDWINYPSTLINYEKRKNSNEWIPK